MLSPPALQVFRSLGHVNLTFGKEHLEVVTLPLHTLPPLEAGARVSGAMAAGRSSHRVGGAARMLLQQVLHVRTGLPPPANSSLGFASLLAFRTLMLRRARCGGTR